MILNKMRSNKISPFELHIRKREKKVKKKFVAFMLMLITGLCFI